MSEEPSSMGNAALMNKPPAAEQVFPEAEYFALFQRVSEVLGESLDYRVTLQNVANSTVATISDVCIIDLGDGGQTEMVSAAHRDSALTKKVQAAGAHLSSKHNRPQHPVCRVLATGEMFYAPHIDNAWIEQHSSGPEHAGFLSELKYTSMIVVPLLSEAFGLTGALTLATVEGGRPPFRERAVAFSQALGRLCAAAIGKARMYGDSQATAAMYQQAALPQRLPQAPGVEFFSHYQPAARTQLVGGDWYDAFTIPNGRIGISIGDVSGHGLRASVVMSSMRNSIRTALISEPDIARALDSVDYVLRSEFDDVSFCTAVLAVLDVDAMTLRLASAGHPGPRIWSAKTNEVADPFTERDLPLGIRPLSQNRAQPRTMRLEKGFVVFYTDGLVECTRNMLDGERDLNQAMMRADVRNAENPAEATREAMSDCTDSPDDDIAILAMRLA